MSYRYLGCQRCLHIFSIFPHLETRDAAILDTFLAFISKFMPEKKVSILSTGSRAVCARLGAPVPAGRPEAAVPAVRQAEQERVPLVVALGHLRAVDTSGATVFQKLTF